MADKARTYILTRRLGTGFDFQAETLQSGNLTVDHCVENGIWRVNCSQMVGIATATEVGLTPERYPIRVVISADYAESNEVHTCIKFWRVYEAGGHTVRFQRRPFETDRRIVNIYKLVPDLDDLFWDAYGDGHIRGMLAGEEVTRRVDAIYNNTALAEMTPDIMAETQADIRALIEEGKAADRLVGFRVAENAFFTWVPAGKAVGEVGAMPPQAVVALEAACTVKINYDRLRKRHERVTTGVISAAAHTIAAMFRYSLYEAYEHQEFYTVVCMPSENSSKQFVIRKILTHKTTVAPVDLNVGDRIDLADVKLNEKMLQLGPGLVVASGVNHYMFNHTTGGAVISGPLLTTLSMYRLVHKDMDRGLQEDVTSVFYEVLHPTNKRGIANMFFAKAGVTTHGKMGGSHRYERFVLDTFLSIRMQPYPAGSHKAFLTATVLKRIIRAGFSAFLPWAEQINDCIQVCKEVLTAGARAHIGSHYYTGMHGVSQPSALDKYLPDLAAYLGEMCRGDSLSFSPHFSPEVSARADPSWLNLLKEIKGRDISATDPEIVGRYLRASGAVFIGVNPDDETTWGAAAAAGKAAERVIDSIFE